MARPEPAVGETWPVTARTLRPELEVILCCARTHLDAGRALRVGALCAGDLDWDHLIGQARRHGLDPLLYCHVSALGAARVPARALDRLRVHFETNAVRNRLLSAELGKVLAALDAHGIAAIPYKGPVLAASVYGDLSLRRFADLDVLVRRADVPRCKDALHGLGYEPRLRLTRGQERAYLGSECEYAFDRDRGRLTVEVHWDITPRDYAFRFDIEHLWRTVRPVSANGMTVLAPLPEDLLLMLAVHGSKHLWERLAWLVDIAEVLRVHPGLDWPALLGRARERGGARMLLLALGLTRDLLGVELPAAMASAVKADAKVMTLARRVGDALVRGAIPPARSIAAIRIQMGMRERRRDRVTYALRLAFTPTIEDWASVRLPAALLPIHYLLRPFRLAAKRGAMGLRRPR